MCSMSQEDGLWGGVKASIASLGIHAVDVEIGAAPQLLLLPSLSQSNQSVLIGENFCPYLAVLVS